MLFLHYNLFEGHPPIPELFCRQTEEYEQLKTTRVEIQRAFAPQVL